MAKGAFAKEAITKTILETFPGSFVIDKVIRIPMTEDGAPIQIKVALTAAKDIVDAMGDADLSAFNAGDYDFSAPTSNTSAPVSIEPTPEEKANVKLLLERLGL